MTADEFHLNISTDRVEMIVSDTDMKVKTEIYYEDFIDALNSNDYIREWVLEKMRDICINNWELGRISDIEKDRFLTILEAMR